MNEKLIKRDKYLNKLISYKDKDIIKVITGLRRSGKSSILKLMIEHLKENKISEKQIIYMNFEMYEYSKMSADDLYYFIKDKIIKDKKMYLFFDEIQEITSYEKVINGLRVEFNTDIYITGSNAYLLSGELATYLSGRYIEIKILPLSFKEFIEFQKYKIIKNKNKLNEISYDLYEENKIVDKNYLFKLYLRYGGMPQIIELGLNDEQALAVLEGIYNTVIIKDILERADKKKITDATLLKKIIYFLADNISNNISISNIGKILTNEGLIKKDSKAPSINTVQNYVNSLMEAFLFYEIKRFDIKGKEYLKTLGKYYITDIGIRNYILGYRERDYGHILENIVYLELLRRGYSVAVGKIKEYEIDFIAIKYDDKKYIQVTETMTSEECRKRELRPLQMIEDNYEKIILTKEIGLENNFEGIKVINIVDWLLDD